MTPVEALQKALAAEHAAVFLFGVLGARTSTGQQPTLAGLLEVAFETHRARRDRLTELVSAHDASPVAALVDYRVPGGVDSPAAVTATARTIEDRVTRTYAELVANTSGEDRRWAIAALDASALSAVGFGQAPSDFPGLG